MGASASNLDNYGYDYVLAVTQQSINDTAFDFLKRKQPVLSVCYVYDDNGDPQRMDYEQFKKLAGGTDPFDVPASGPDHDAAVKRLDEAGLMFGFQAAIGRPAGFAVSSLPPLVTFGAAAGDPVVYRLLCRTFTLVELKAIPHKTSVYAAFSQPVGPAGEPWVFSYNIDLVQKPVADVQQFLASAASQSLPTATRDKVAANPSAFSIQQLLFDFAEASGPVRPEITGVSGLLREKLYADFSIEYFTQMKNSGPPMLAVLPTGNDPLANLRTEFSVNPNPSHPELACLNYLCTTPDHQLPAAQSFPWAWVEPGENQAGDFDGVVVVSRKHLAEHLRGQLNDYVEKNKWLPNPVYIEVGLVTYDAQFGVSARHLDWHGHPPDDLKILTETFEALDSGQLVLHWNYGTSREYDYASGTSWLRGETSFELKVTFRGDQIIVEQHALVFCKIVMVTFWRREWNLVDLLITDTFTLSTTHDGQLTATPTTHTEDHSSKVDGMALVPDLYDRFTGVQKAVRAYVTSALVDIPLAILDNIIFPGGRSFLFKKVTFSDHQDLIAHITYTDQT